MLTEEEIVLISNIKNEIDWIESLSTELLELKDSMDYRINKMNHYLKKLENPLYTFPWEKPDAIEKLRQYESLGALLRGPSC